MAYKYYKDNRSYIKALLKTGDAIVCNEEVDWDLEMGAIVRRTCEKRGPAIHFKKIKDYRGFEALGAPIATHRPLLQRLSRTPRARRLSGRATMQTS